MTRYSPLLELDPYQGTGAAWLAGKDQALLADFMGIGKSAEAVRACDLVNAKTILVICPGNARVNWQREFERFSPMDRSCCVVMPGKKIESSADVWVLSYEMATTMADELKRRQHDVLILDEAHYCFPYDIGVQTKNGSKAIGEICESTIDEYVLCCDLSTNELEYRRVTNRIKTKLYEDLVEVVHEHGSFVCTADHEIWTDRGYVAASEIKETDSLCVVWKRSDGNHTRNQHDEVLFEAMRAETAVLRPTSRTEAIEGAHKKSPAKNLRMVQDRFFDAESLSQSSEILQSKLRSQVANESSGGGGRSERETLLSATPNAGSKETRFCQENARKQSDERSESQTKNDQRFAWSSVSGRARRERKIFCAADAISRSDRTGDGAPREYGESERSLQQDSVHLRPGSSSLGKENRRGDRRPLAQHAADTCLGQKERRGFVGSRVVSIEIQKRGSDGQPSTDCGADTFVYCLEVEKHQNFFANGVLVSNCKERSAKRTKAIYGARRDVPGIIASATRCWRLTGTPAPSHAGELFTHFKSAGLATEPYYDWVFRYCTGFDSNYGFKITGHKNEAELRARLEPFMLRRMEGTDLPPLCFETVSVERSDELLKKFISKDAATEDEQLRAALSKPSANALATLESTASSYSTLRRFTVLAKLPAIAEILEQNFDSGMDKIVLFGVHIEAIEWMAGKLKKFFPVMLYGKTPANKKQAVVDQFQNDPHCRLLIGNIQAAGVAITLTAGCEVGFMEKSWVPGDIVQALKRCHRRGQTRGVRVRSFTLYDSSDELVDEALMRKVKELAKIL